MVVVPIVVISLNIYRIPGLQTTKPSAEAGPTPCPASFSRSWPASPQASAMCLYHVYRRSMKPQQESPQRKRIYLGSVLWPLLFGNSQTYVHLSIYIYIQYSLFRRNFLLVLDLSTLNEDALRSFLQGARKPMNHGTLRVRTGA